MKRSMLGLICVAFLASIGCKDLKEQQLGAYVADKQTKVVYKNVGKNTEIVPKDRRVFFRSQSEAIDQGYTPENVAGSDPPANEE